MNRFVAEAEVVVEGQPSLTICDADREAIATMIASALVSALEGLNPQSGAGRVVGSVASWDARGATIAPPTISTNP